MFRGFGFRADVSGFRVQIFFKKIWFRIDDLGFRVEFYGLGFKFRNSIIREKLKQLMNKGIRVFYHLMKKIFLKMYL